MDWPSLWSLGTNNVLVGTSIHGMSASAVQTADTAALAERANNRATSTSSTSASAGISHWPWGCIGPIGGRLQSRLERAARRGEVALHVGQTGGVGREEVVEPRNRSVRTCAFRSRMVCPCEEGPAGLTTEPLLRREG